MASREDWCADKLSKLLDQDLRISTLTEIKEHLVSLNQDEQIEVVNSLQLPLVFDCLNDSNTEQVDLACEVLTLCLNNLNLGESTSKYGVPLERALMHPYSSVKLMALKEIERNITKENVINEFCNKQRLQLFLNIVHCVGDEDLAVGKKASEIITEIGQRTPGTELLVCTEVSKKIREIMNINEVVRLRGYEIFIDIGTKSESSFEILRTFGYFTEILLELDSTDVLVKMNVVELLSRLGTCRHGYIFLDVNGVLTKLFGMFDYVEDAVMLDLCEPGILKFFGNIAHQRPLQLLSKYPQVFDRVFANIESRDLIIVGISLDTLGYIGATNEGKIALDTTGNKITYAIKTITKLLASLPTEFRIRALNCLEKLLHLQEFKSELSNITRKWYFLLGDIPMDIILKYANNPFSEIRIAGFGIMKSIAAHYWGQEEIKNSPGLVEFLLDRNAESIKECKEIKYEIVKILSQCETFDHPTTNRFKKFVNEGPFYVGVVTQVAIEGNE